MRGNKKESGLTLTEILVTTAIIVILSGLVIANSGAGQNQLALSRSANKLAQDIRRVQEMAMSAEECDECGGVGVIPPRYGIYLDQNPFYNHQYILFADYPGGSDGKFYWPHDLTKDTEIETISFEKNIVISDVSKGNGTCLPGNPSGPKRGHISFAPPDPTTGIWIGEWPAGGTNAVQCQEIILTLRAGTSGPTKVIRVNQAGLISVE